MNSPPPIARRRVLLVAAATWVAPAFAQPPADKRSRRPYDEGPLRGDEFYATAPAKDRTAPMTLGEAYLHARLEYKYTTRIDVLAAGVSVTLVTFDADAILQRDLSWNRNPRNAALLDHEQGHFDIPYILALQWNRKISELIKAGRSYKIRAASKDSGEAEMKRRLQQEFAEYTREMTLEHAAYDAATKHGIERERQTEYRAVQRRKIKQLQGVKTDK